MEAKEALSTLVTHLLGDDWYIIGPVASDQANDIIVEEIKGRYKGVTESPTNKWRRARVNRRCLFCQHYKSHKSIALGIDSERGACIAKDRIVNGDIHRPFCKVFQLKSFYGKEEK